MVPIDKELIDKKILNYSEKKWLNEYHQKVFDCLKESMNNSEILELRRLVQLFNKLYSFSVIILILNSLA